MTEPNFTPAEDAFDDCREGCAGSVGLYFEDLSKRIADLAEERDRLRAIVTERDHRIRALEASRHEMTEALNSCVQGHLK